MKLVPIGIENFKEMIDKNAYYVDKTNLIENVLDEQSVFFYKTSKIWENIKYVNALLFLFYQGKRKCISF